MKESSAQNLPRKSSVDLLNGKELARELKRSPWFVSVMRAEGYQFAYGTLTTLEHALA